MFNYRSNNGSVAKERDGGAKHIAAQTIGVQLRERREALGATLAEIESATKIRQKYLSALESDEWQMLPGEVIGRGFLRNYAAYLGLESNELVERRRAITEPGVINILSNTSAGVRLPEEREVDYRPREMDLREDPDVIESRQVSVGPYLVGLLAVALLALIGWSLYQYGGEVRTQFAKLADSVGTTLTTAMARPATATPRPPTPTTVATSLQEAPTVQSDPNGTNPVAVQPTATSSDQAAGVLVLPTATNTPEVAATPAPEQPTAAPTQPPPTPTPQLSTLSAAANLRSGPGTDFEITGAGQPGEQIKIVGRSADGQWFLLDSNVWVFAQLVTNPPANAPVAGQAATPTAAAPQETATAVVEQPTAAPPPAVVAAACPNSDAVVTFPGVNQVLAGSVTVSGVANREPFQYWKVEVNGVVVGTGNVPVGGGSLLSFDSNSFPNGAATLVLTSVDITGNFSDCAVQVVIQN